MKFYVQKINNKWQQLHQYKFFCFTSLITVTHQAEFHLLFLLLPGGLFSWNGWFSPPEGNNGGVPNAGVCPAWGVPNSDDVALVAGAGVPKPRTNKDFTNEKKKNRRQER